ncbi:universal stress protein [bacterium]|nr:universal stress protein [bacterium]
MIKSILLAVDGSVYTDAQVSHVIDFAKSFEAKIHIVSVVDVRVFEWALALGTEGFVPVIPSRVYQDESKRVLESKADAVLEKCTSIIGEQGLECQAEKIHGPPADVICEKAHLVDLLIMGARGEYAKWESMLVGATLEAVVRQCNKPIFISPKDFKSIDKVLIAYDGSDKANHALQMAAFFASKLDVKVTVLTIGENESLRNKFLQEARTYLSPHGINAEPIGIPGSADKGIVDYAHENGVDLIIMGAFGHSRIREAILGSTTEQVMRKSRIPILLCK